MMANKSSRDNEKDYPEEELLIMSKTLIASVWWTKEMGERLKILRGEESMASLAKRAGCSYQSIQHLERGEYTIEERKGLKPSVSWEKLEGICKALDITVEDFLQVQLVKNPKNMPPIA
ncbi:helix-turn-helix transcriptional regulator [Nostoc sp. FACHB-87]|uniref:helix-turn-helix transcriptional regulator n=1 Tax=Nostocaceae TaxID=1162 RepID=UPI001688ECFF|nr:MULTISPECIES: helix-turn-helix transcriptional regulator [Nostocaceae]MBD2458767.1 helix-turn-helix transcriptional regulator [Nostoc sp. FACHB-87]MBD2479813.1 helix-turn-helix transcriptional regulator [Anabaena sp. FACHB-83]